MGVLLHPFKPHGQDPTRLLHPAFLLLSKLCGQESQRERERETETERERQRERETERERDRERETERERQREASQKASQ